MSSVPGLAKLSTRSAGLGKKSQGGALDKASIISIAKKSLYTTSGLGDGHIKIDVEDDEVPWHAVDTAEEVVQDLVSNSSTGLSAAEAARRLTDYGPNKLTPPDKPGFFRKLWSQLNNILIYILAAAAVVEGALQSWAEFGLVLGVIVINTAIGLIQEGKAEKAAEAIKAMLSQNARVLRDGEVLTVPAEELVPGDIVLIKSGDKVPADMRLITANNLQVQEAMLTGESVPVSKTIKAAPKVASLGDRKCLCYSATAVTSGQAQGVVVGTGDSAEIGQINKMVSTVANVRNNLLYQLEILGRWLAILVGVIAFIAFLLALLHVKMGFKGAFESALVIAVAIIPEGLPAMVTIVLAIGTTVMARNNAIIRQLPAVETLGSLNVICSDKTGTLTKNEMTAVNVRTATNCYAITGVGYAPQGIISVESAAASAAPTGPDGVTTAPAGNSSALDESGMSALKLMLEGAVLCNDSALSRETHQGAGKTVFTPQGAPTEVALLTLGEKAGLMQKELCAAKPRVHSVPFESEHKFMATAHQEAGGRRVLYVKGAPERLLPLCTGQVAGDDVHAAPEPLDAKFWQQEQAALSSKGLRVLALCRIDLAPEFDVTTLNAKSLLQSKPFLTMVLIVAILDPPREEAVEAIKVAHTAGITVKMITGDHSLTALAIGKMLGIAGNGVVFTGPEIDRTNDDALKALVVQCNVFARASPENKLRIVRALQELNQTVAMTGDGVNDAPALKAADVGVAMGITGTDVSKEAAKMVLADDNFASIVAAVREGRRVWDNIRKILVFNLPVNLAQGTSVLYSYILGLPNAPLTTLQVLLVNLVTSVTLGLALAAEPAEPTVMTRPPRRPGKRLVGKLLLWRCLFVCHLVVVLVIGMFFWATQTGLALPQARAEAFNVLVGAQVVYFICCRFLKTSTVHPRVFKGNPMVFISVPLTLALMVFLTYTPGVNTFFNMAGMTGIQWARVVTCMGVIYFTVEIEKALVDPVLMPIIRPVLRAIENMVPEWLTVDRPLKARMSQLCGKPQRTLSMRMEQRKGKIRKSVKPPASEQGSENAQALEVAGAGAEAARDAASTAAFGRPAASAGFSTQLSLVPERRKITGDAKGDNEV